MSLAGLITGRIVGGREGPISDPAADYFTCTVQCSTDKQRTGIKIKSRHWTRTDPTKLSTSIIFTMSQGTQTEVPRRSRIASGPVSGQCECSAVRHDGQRAGIGTNSGVRRKSIRATAAPQIEFESENESRVAGNEWIGTVRVQYFIRFKIF